MRKVAGIVTALLLGACGNDNGGNAPPMLEFTAPAANASIPFNTPTRLDLLLSQNGAPVGATPVTVVTSRGTLASTQQATPCSTPAGTSPITSLSLTTDNLGQASAWLCSDGTSGSGGTIVTAQAQQLSATLNLLFIATTPASLVIQATPTTVEPSGSSTVVARVYDPNSNPVPGKLVDFTLNDASGGSLSQASATSDASGMATVTYRANPAYSGAANAQAQINAQVHGTTVASQSPASITVVGSSRGIDLGTNNQVGSLDAQHYQTNWAVSVVDSVGNPVPGETVKLSVQAIAYQKGQWLACKTSQGQAFAGCQGSNPPAWAQDAVVPSSDPHYNGPPSSNPLYLDPYGCITEDPNNTGVYSPTLDYNGNGVLDPGVVATVPASVQTDSTGSAMFALTYPKDHALWVEVRLQATLGSNMASMTLILPIAAADVSSPSTPPPGVISPYGTVASCANPH